MRLLEIIRADRMLGKEDQVNLDFFPNYHVGPSEELGKYCVGTYGACWDNWGGDTNPAIWAMVCRIIPQAKKQGIDFEGEHTAFRQWLEKSSCWRVKDVLEALPRLSDPEYDVAEFAALVDCRNPDHFGDVVKFTSKIKHRPQGWKWFVPSFSFLLLISSFSLTKLWKYANTKQGNSKNPLRYMPHNGPRNILLVPKRKTHRRRRRQHNP
jgi:hypothetical protein